MSRFLRKVRRGYWETHHWLGVGEISGDAFRDTLTRGGKLSVYRVADEMEGRQVAVALAATRDHVSSMDYIIFEGSDLCALGITKEKSDGDTPDMVVNRLHYELGNLTTKRLAQLAEIISDGKSKRILKKQMKAWLTEATDTGRLEMDMVRDSLTKELLR